MPKSSIFGSYDSILLSTVEGWGGVKIPQISIPVSATARIYTKNQTFPTIPDLED